MWNEGPALADGVIAGHYQGAVNSCPSEDLSIMIRFDVDRNRHFEGAYYVLPDGP